MTFASLLALAGAAQAQHNHSTHFHPPQDALIHEQFYSTWMMPDNPKRSCCNKLDCYPTEIRYSAGTLFAKRREDGQFIYVPEQKIERHRDNPDGRNHVCMPPPNHSQAGSVFCFIFGNGM
jgi:hypothetical protein